MIINYWTAFSKRKNSTKQPSSGTQLDVKLKDDCSIINPVFESAQMPANVNFIYVPDWGRYYFVNNVIYTTKTIKNFICEVDCLATAKAGISN